ncbi:MAG: DGQHR domain-containing protein [Planctomycetes bacterium]|nr:DGQHR domain-containing protein [Planctomycetota bacterium]
MLATRVSQKESLFYFVAWPAADLLTKVRFTTRFEAAEGRLAVQPKGEDEIASFITKVEQSEKAFQRTMAKAKIGQIRNFYETCGAQPMIPGTVLLFTAERLRFTATGGGDGPNGSLTSPDHKFLIIDGQHRLAALHFHLQKHPEEATNIHVPCVVFDGRNEDFAAEMFVIINSTPTRINKSHLIDLYERVSFATPNKKLAAKVVDRLYGSDDSPLQYRINRLGGRSGQEKWILQAELFNEVHRWLKGSESSAQEHVEAAYVVLRDFFKACAVVFGEAWGSDRSMVTKPVTLKALVRVAADLAASDTNPAEGRVRRWTERMQPWTERLRDFRSEGFYERFPAKGQVERVVRIQRDLAQAIGVVGRRAGKR